MGPSPILSKAFLLLLMLAGSWLLPTKIQANTFAYAFAGQMASGSHFAGKFVIDTSQSSLTSSNCSVASQTVFDYPGYLYEGLSTYMEVTVTEADGSSFKLQNLGVGEANSGANIIVSSCPASTDAPSSGFRIRTDDAIVNGVPIPNEGYGFNLYFYGPPGLINPMQFNAPLPPLRSFTVDSSIELNYSLILPGHYEGNGGQITCLEPLPDPTSNGCGVELLDPVPDLVTVDGVSTDSQRLTNANHTVDGVAADGVTRVVVRVPSLTSGSSVTVQLEDENNAAVSQTDDYGALQPIDQQDADLQSSLTLTANDSGTLYFLYRAPIDFARPSHSEDAELASRLVHLKITTPDNEQESPVLIYRPPTILIHGVWSDLGPWSDFTTLIQNPAFSSNIGRVNYKSTNGARFYINEPKVHQQIDNYLNVLKAQNRMAAIQVDVVGHSMGGLLTRMLALRLDYRNPRNFYTGTIHKLITIDTPHLGSAFAVRLQDPQSAPCRSLIESRSQMNGAVDDLATGSTALNELNSASGPISLKVHTIVGIASPGQEQATESGQLYQFLGRLCSPLAATFQVVFQGQSDLIVSDGSQAGTGLEASGAATFGYGMATSVFLAFVHATYPAIFSYGPADLGKLGTLTAGSAPDPQAIAKEAVRLLNTSVKDPAFGDMFP